LEDSVFRNCTNLVTVNLTINVTIIGNYVFKGCTSLTTISNITGLTFIGLNAFESTAITTFTIPTGVETVSNFTFKNCIYLTTVNLPSTITAIGDQEINGSSFEGCIALASVSGLSNVTYIGGASFKGCTNNPLTLDFSEAALTYIGRRAFEGCTYLTTVDLAGSTESLIDDNIRESAFANSGITSITLPTGITTLSSYTFNECTSLASVTLSANLRIIAANMFTGCTALTSITIPSNVITIGFAAFQYSGIQTITFNRTLPPQFAGSLETERVFANMQDQQTAYIPNGTVAGLWTTRLRNAGWTAAITN